MDDFQKILDLNFPFAKKLLTEYGEFYPFAVAINNLNIIEQILLEEDEEFDHPKSNSVLGELKKEIAFRKNEFRATAIFYDVRVDGKDAIAIDVEHRIEKHFYTFYYYYELENQILKITHSEKSVKLAEIYS